MGRLSNSVCAFFVVLSLLSNKIMSSNTPVNHYEMGKIEECLSVFEIGNLSYSNLSLSCDCESLLVLNVSEFEYVDNSTVLLNGLTLEVQFKSSQGLPVVCTNLIQNPGVSFPVAFKVIAYVGDSLSIIGCCLVFLTFFLFQELHTLPAKIMVNVAITVLIGNVVLILNVAGTTRNSDFCVAIAIFTHFIVLAQFSWMTIMCGEVCHSFYQASRLIPVRVEGMGRKLLVYITIAWTTPLLVVVPSIIVNFSTPALVQYGNQGQLVCWVSHFGSEILVIIIPAAITVFIQSVLFAGSIFFLVKTSKSRNSDRGEKRTPYLRVVVAMFFASNIVWIFGLIALSFSSTWLSYLFVILISSQGFVIFFGFYATRKVLKLYIARLYKFYNLVCTLLT